jgi:predicted ATP-grasp superfamily ATP-dependent carboligase
MNYYVIRCPYRHWVDSIKENTNINCVDSINNVPNTDVSKIIPLLLADMRPYRGDKRLLFLLNADSVHIMDSKCIFSDYMMRNFPENYPKVHYINSDKIRYISYEYVNKIKKKMIKKKNIGCAGDETSIVYDASVGERDTVIIDYIEHNEFYVGHFFVMNGQIKKQIYLKASTNNNSNFILTQPITNYSPEMIENLNNLNCHNVFVDIFQKLKYTGFACSDFVISNAKIIIFEINPRPGGSLFTHKEICKDFFNYVMSGDL